MITKSSEPLLKRLLADVWWDAFIGDRTLSRARCGEREPPCRLDDPTASQARHKTQPNSHYRACRMHGRDTSSSPVTAA